MNERYETFHHVADAWTVGRLREALEGLPDDLPLQVAVPEDDDECVDDTWVITSAGFGSVLYGDERGEQLDRHLTIELDRPTGAYERLVDDGRRDGDGEG